MTPGCRRGRGPELVAEILDLRSGAAGYVLHVPRQLVLPVPVS